MVSFILILSILSNIILLSILVSRPKVEAGGEEKEEWKKYERTNRKL